MSQSDNFPFGAMMGQGMQHHGQTGQMGQQGGIQGWMQNMKRGAKFNVGDMMHAWYGGGMGQQQPQMPQQGQPQMQTMGMQAPPRVWGQWAPQAQQSPYAGLMQRRPGLLGQ